MRSRKPKKKVSFVFETVLLILSVLAGFVMLVAEMINPFLHQYVFVAIIVLEAFCLAMLFSIIILVRKIKKQEKINRDEEY